MENTPIEIKKFNWGAFILTWIWGIGNNYYLPLILFIPILGLIIWVPMAFYLGFKGNEIAYKNYKGDIENFNRIQRNWAKAAIAVVLAIIIFVFLILMLTYSILNKFSNETVTKFVDITYNSQNFEKLCNGNSNKNECVKFFENMYLENGKISNIKVLGGEVNTENGHTTAELYDKGTFEQSGKKVYIKTKIEKDSNQTKFVYFDISLAK